MLQKISRAFSDMYIVQWRIYCGLVATVSLLQPLYVRKRIRELPKGAKDKDDKRPNDHDLPTVLFLVVSSLKGVPVFAKKSLKAPKSKKKT